MAACPGNLNAGAAMLAPRNLACFGTSCGQPSARAGERAQTTYFACGALAVASGFK